jgi:acyl-CoA thioester hydrolase
VVVAKASCTYKRSARFDDVLRIRTCVTQSRRRTITFAYEVFNDADSTLIATGETLHVICDSHGRPKSLPEKYRRYFPLTHAADSVTTGTAHKS